MILCVHLKILRFAYTTDLEIPLVFGFLGVYILVQYYFYKYILKNPVNYFSAEHVYCFCVRLDSLRIQLGYTLPSGGGGGLLCISSDREDQIGAKSKPKQIA